MLDRLWGGATQGGVRVYDVAAYRAGFALAHRVARLLAGRDRVHARDALPSAGRRGGARSPERGPAGVRARELYRGVSGTPAMTCSASAVIVSAGFTPRFAGTALPSAT